jgi:hypothetical protein
MVQDTRMIAACLQVVYTGQLQNSSGQIGFIENFPLSAVLTGGGGGAQASVNDLFQYASHTTRLGIDKLEVVYSAEDRNAKIFTDEKTGALSAGVIGASSTELTQEAKTIAPKCFGFVWRGIDPGAGTNLSFEFVKSIEWRPNTGQGVEEFPVCHYGESRLPVVQAALDKSRPGWTRRVMDAVGSKAAKIAQIAFSGITSDMGRAAISAIPRIAMASAPLMLL